jgi:hypothetical protein
MLAVGSGDRTYNLKRIADALEKIAEKECK